MVKVKRSRFSKMSDNKKLFLDISLKEYTEIRTELRDIISRQYTVLLSSITMLATLVGIAITILSIKPEILNNKHFWASNILCVMIPCLSILLGILWIDLAYRQITMGRYVYTIEKQINRMVCKKKSNKITRKALYWEHCVKANNKLSLFSYISAMMIFLLLPIICFVTYFVFSGNKWETVYYLSIGLFGAGLVVIGHYIISIFKVYKTS